MDLLAHSFESNATPLRDTFDRASPLHPSSVEMNLTDMKPEGCDYSIGDISPIKFVYSNLSQQDHSPEDASPQLALPDVSLQQPNPFYVIRSFANVFRKFKYTLPCLQGIGLPSVNLGPFSPIRQIHTNASSSNVELNLKVAQRRVEAAVCAFGGTVQDYRRHAQSIFRLRDRVTADTRAEYEKALAGRYYVSGNRLSWGFEENPPVTILDKEDSVRAQNRATTGHLTSSPYSRSSTTDRLQSSPGSTTSMQSNDSKLKYRCKLCGQIKNNHDCPYRQPLQRSIGIMVYPAVNSFTAFEPGTVAPPLTKMNNFVSYDSDYSATPRTEEHPSDPHPQTQRLMDSFTSAESGARPVHQHSLFYSPQSSLSSHEDNHQHYPSALSTPGSQSTLTRKRPREEEDRKSLFVASVTLRPEHYRAVTPSDSPLAFSYPAVPLTFAERKRLSDTLFHLSKEMPHLTAECATVLRLAREHDDWDLAIAELMTQVLVGLYCHTNDTRLDGLSDYLLALGISC